MNPSKALIMASIVALGTVATSCGDKANEEKKIIEKPQFTVTDGKLTPELMFAFGKVSSPVISPDKTKILYSIGYDDIAENRGNNEIWVMDIDGKNQTRLTTTADKEHDAVWIDGGQRIAFLCADKDGNSQVFTMNADGSNRQVATSLEKGVDAFVISPDEKKIVLVSNVKWRERANDRYKDLDKTSGRIIDDLMYKHWDQWVEEIPHPFVADFDGTKAGEATDIMEGEPYEAPMLPFGGAESITWSPDSKNIVYVSRKKEGMEYAVSTNSDLYEYNIETKQTKNLTEGMMGYDTMPVFSPDGTKLAWLSMEHDGYEADKNRIFIMDTKTGEKTDLSADWDYTADNLAWSEDGKSLFLLIPYHGSQPIFKLDIATKEFTRITEGDYDFAALAVCGNDHVITLRHSLQEPNEIYAVDANAKTIAQLTTENNELLKQLAPVKIEKRMVKTTDGKEMLTWVVFPPNFDPNKKYPALLYCQGGPQSQVSQFWSQRWNLRLMASQGYIVIAPNRRGLPGFGTEWNAQISKDYGGQNMKDYLAAVDDVKKESYIDIDHIGATGASYGGFSVYWLAGHHEGRFAAFFAHAGIFNLEQQYVETEEMWFANWDMGGAFWDKENAIAQNTFANSPHKFVGKWDTPIMISVGEKDYRIVATQGMAAFNAAKLRGIPARLLVYPDENHWILKPQNSLLFHREFIRWFDQYLKPEQK